MNTGDDNASMARQLLAGACRGVISTHSLEHRGYPFGSVVPYVLDRDGVPLLLLSHLSQHTKNLEADPHCGLTIMEEGSGDVQQLNRLSAVGRVSAVGPGGHSERYFNHFPQTRVYHEELGFNFYRLEPVRFHWNAGFATARWFDASRILRGNPFDAAAEQQIIGHMNTDHRTALRQYLSALTQGREDPVVEMVGIDGEGMNLRLDDRFCRIAFPREVANVEEARTVLVEMAAP